MDDILVWVESLPQLVDRVKIIAERYKKINIVLSRKEFKIGGFSLLPKLRQSSGEEKL